MRVYCLESVKLADDHNWAASTHRERCWVLAESEEDARRKVAMATGIATTVHHPIPTSPWKDQRLTTCYEDRNPPREIPADVVCTESGQMLSIKCEVCPSLGALTRMAQDEEPGLRGGEAGGRGRLGPLGQRFRRSRVPLLCPRPPLVFSGEAAN